MTLSAYEGLAVYYGDIHNHCNVGIAYGTAETAYENARTQLDFASVTAQTYWHDMPQPVDYLKPIVAYHEEGFERATQLWPHLKQVTEEFNSEGDFVTFLSFEWHSAAHGDHVVYYKEGQGDMIRAESLQDLRTALRHLAQEGVDCFLVPHHIAYARGFRSIDWAEFTREFTPVVEIVSMHGVAESDEAPYPYLHDMGPRAGRNTMQAGLAEANVFGVLGSTDHHSAHPGSYGRGRAAVWADALSRDAVWTALARRRTYALTGDRIELQFAVNGQPMGSVLPATPERQIEVAVVGGDALDYVEVLHNNRAIHRWSAHEANLPDAADRVKVLLELGWGQYNKPVEWQVELEVMNGKILSVEPRFRGPDILSPQSAHAHDDAFSTWKQSGNHLSVTTRTWGNPNTTTSATQAICLEIRPEGNTQLLGQINGHPFQISIENLREQSQVGFLGDFLSAAYLFHRAVPSTEYTCRTSFSHTETGARQDFYYARVRQKNNQWAWSSPIWAEAVKGEIGKI